MTGTIRIEFGDYVRHRLQSWGREFRLDREYAMLGHKSKDMLQVLIEHKGEMPPRTIGYKPLTIHPLVMEVEDIVHALHAERPVQAAVMRVFYCSGGRHAERRELAESIIRRRLSRATYYAAHGLGFAFVSASLEVGRYVQR